MTNSQSSCFISDGERRIRSSKFRKGLVIKSGEGAYKLTNIVGPKLCLPPPPSFFCRNKTSLPPSPSRGVAPSPFPVINNHSLILAPAPPLETWELSRNKVGWSKDGEMEEDIRTRICTKHKGRKGPRVYNQPLYTRGRFYSKYLHTRTENDLVCIVVHYRHEVVFLCP